jgi:hypothetical protein
MESGLGDSKPEELARYIAEIQKLSHQLKHERIAKLLYTQMKVTIEHQDKYMAAE